jgi:hypothetical protein
VSTAAGTVAYSIARAGNVVALDENSRVKFRREATITSQRNKL